MSKIAIQSTEKLQFPPAYIGFVEMEIDLIQNKPEQEIYDLRIIDRVFDWVQQELESEPQTAESGEPTAESEPQTIKKIFATQTRLKSYHYEELSQLAKILNLDKKKFKSETEYINELFRQGLLIMTQQECQQGIAGEGLGMYFSRANQWEIVREEGNN